MKDRADIRWGKDGMGAGEPLLPSWFLGGALCWFLAGLIAVLVMDRVTLHLALNTFHPPLVDEAMRVLTYVGDGWTAAAVTVALWWVNRRAALMSALGNISAGVLAQVLKHYAFPGALRPSAVFAQLHIPLPAVSGVELYAYHSFPSGHAATAWATLLVLAFLSKRPVWQLSALAGAILIAYSRVYLSQHFFADIFAGSVLGAACTLGASRLVMRTAGPATPHNQDGS